MSAFRGYPKTPEGAIMRVGNLPGIRRLPIYLNLLRLLKGEGKETASAAALADKAGLVASVVRKDIEMTGAVGTTGIGFNIDSLIGDIEAFLGWDNPHDAFLVGAGSLGVALLGHKELTRHGLKFVAAFDADEAKAGTRPHGIEVFPPDKLPELARRLRPGVVVITVPAGHAQAIADIAVAAGVRRIWSFAAEILQVPPGITVQREDLSAGLAELLVRSTAQRDA
jgi:redox-sensing transcriptional repressor